MVQEEYLCYGIYESSVMPALSDSQAATKVLGTGTLYSLLLFSERYV